MKSNLFMLATLTAMFMLGVGGLMELPEGLENNRRGPISRNKEEERRRRQAATLAAKHAATKSVEQHADHKFA